jgi:hypothetical protein
LQISVNGTIVDEVQLLKMVVATWQTATGKLDTASIAASCLRTTEIVLEEELPFGHVL